MSEAFFALLAFVAGFAFAACMAADVRDKDCLIAGQFRSDERVFECRLKAGDQ